MKKYDYISEPKGDGYRSVHFVYKYRSRDPKHAVYNGLRIEIQIRSRLQHAWATAVETVDILTGQALKSKIGSPDWKRFFALMSGAIAIRERRPRVSGMPETPGNMVAEVRKLVKRLKIEDVLTGFSAGMHLTQRIEAGDTYLLILDSKKGMTQVRTYRTAELRKASEDYTNIEKASIDKPEIEAVLVSVDSIRRLRSAYPNFYLDTRAFLKVVRTFVGNK